MGPSILPSTTPPTAGIIKKRKRIRLSRQGWNEGSQETTQRLVLLLLLATAIGTFWGPLKHLVVLSITDDRYSHVLLGPPLCVAFLYLRRRRIAAMLQPSPKVGALIIALSLVMFGLISVLLPTALQEHKLTLQMIALVLFCVAAFLICYGIAAWKETAVAWLFLTLMVPPPEMILSSVSAVLQVGSAELSFALFRLIDVPVYRNDFVFSLPGVDIEITEECSGLRSSISLVVASLVAGCACLTSAWRRASLAAVAVLIVIGKNALRIVVISWLGVYVDRGFLYGSLHRYGGLPFSVVAVAALLPVLFVLYRSEARLNAGSER